jgi:hypothetical protein
MRRTLTLLIAGAAVALAAAVPAAADAAATDTGSGTLSMKVKVTSFEATKRGIVANGTMIGQLRSGGEVARDTAPVRFRVMRGGQARRRCDVLTLRLAPLFLELLGARVETSHISLDVYARRGRVLGDLFCALSRAEVSFPAAARALNKRLDGRPLRVAASEVPVGARDHQGTCQVLRLVLGPLHLDLLGLVVDLYGRTTQDPVVVTITAVPGHGLLGDLLCAVAGGGGINSLAQLQSLLQSLGVNISDVDLQNLLSNLGINLTDGLSVQELQQLLEALGLGDVPVAP